ncbi:PD-(D/E)XK nuclease family protein [Turneriella parva]|uniref:Uncharacterized protein n=1 Tax=Turneriella parva (strain ATCC BAA-1111 / DSM 21527 / NCTC 11395 / H) TaxID=869212 RepID=I4BAD4_TURPD|nr:PD-(D/E)XK nuclease family protein [Turneriella parva]AFM14241.1 hypothetical protein Turpa_3607 [Turneriella parva DSM 21527]
MLEQFLKEYRQLASAPTEPETAPDLSAFLSDYARLPPDRKRPPKSFLDIIRRPFDENTITDYLAYLLDFDHSEEALAIINWFWNRGNQDPLPIAPADISSFRVKREHTFSDSGRIDLLVFLNGTHLLAVENKIFSGEGISQTESYAASLDEEFPEFKKSMILLSPYSMKPSSDRFVNVLYSELIEYLRSLKYSNKLNASTTENFIYHFEEHFMNKTKFDLSEKSLVYLRHKREIEDVRAAFEKDSEAIFEIAMSFPLKHLAQQTRTQWTQNTNPNRHYQQFTKDSWEAKNDLYFHFEYYLTADSLLRSGAIEFMLHVEGKNNATFFQQFEKEFNQLPEEYRNKGLDYRPRGNRNALASKSYNYEVNPEKLDASAMETFFNETIEDFAFLIPLVDRMSLKH